MYCVNCKNRSRTICKKCKTPFCSRACQVMGSFFHNDCLKLPLMLPGTLIKYADDIKYAMQHPPENGSKVLVSWITQDGYVYIYDAKKSIRKSYSYIIDAVDSQGRDSAKISEIPKTPTFYAITIKQQKYYRVKATHADADKFHVFFIDLGYNRTRHISDLFTIPKNLIDLPQLTHRIKIFGFSSTENFSKIIMNVKAFTLVKYIINYKICSKSSTECPTAVLTSNLSSLTLLEDAYNYEPNAKSNSPNKSNDMIDTNRIEKNVKDSASFETLLIRKKQTQQHKTLIADNHTNMVKTRLIKNCEPELFASKMEDRDVLVEKKSRRGQKQTSKLNEMEGKSNRVCTPTSSDNKSTLNAKLRALHFTEKSKTPPSPPSIQKSDSMLAFSTPKMKLDPVLEPPFRFVKIPEKKERQPFFATDVSKLNIGLVGCIPMQAAHEYKKVIDFLAKFSDKKHYHPVRGEYVIGYVGSIPCRGRVEEVFIKGSEPEYKIYFIDVTNTDTLKAQYLRRYPMELNYDCGTMLCGFENLSVSIRNVKYMERLIKVNTVFYVDEVVHMERDSVFLKICDDIK